MVQPQGSHILHRLTAYIRKHCYLLVISRAACQIELKLGGVGRLSILYTCSKLCILLLVYSPTLLTFCI